MPLSMNFLQYSLVNGGLLDAGVDAVVGGDILGVLSLYTCVCTSMSQMETPALHCWSEEWAVGGLSPDQFCTCTTLGNT